MHFLCTCTQFRELAIIFLNVRSFLAERPNEKKNERESSTWPANLHAHTCIDSSHARGRERQRASLLPSPFRIGIYILVMYRLSYCVCVLALCILFSIFLFGVQWGVREGITEGIIKKSKICRAFVREVTTIIKLALQTPPSLKERYAYRKKVISSYLTY